MAKQKKKKFGSVEEIFKVYVPNYIPPTLREANKVCTPAEKTFDTKFTTGLLKEFQKNIRS